MWYVCDVLYAVLYVCVSCILVRGCSVWRRYIDVCYCELVSVVNVYLEYMHMYTHPQYTLTYVHLGLHI